MPFDLWLHMLLATVEQLESRRVADKSSQLMRMEAASSRTQWMRRENLFINNLHETQLVAASV